MKAGALGAGAPSSVIAPPPSGACGGSFTTGSSLRGLKVAASVLALARSAGPSLLATSSRLRPASSSPCAAAAENQT